MDCTALEAFVRQNVDEQRFIHLQETSRLAQALGERFAPQYSAVELHIISIWHDVARNWSASALRQYAHDNQLACETEEWEHPELLHAPVAAALFPLHYKDCTVEQIQAIRWHTLGSIEMGCLGALLYIADATEPTRSFSERKVILRSPTLTEMVIATIEQTRSYLRQRKQLPLAQSTQTLLKYLQAGGQLA